MNEGFIQDGNPLSGTSTDKPTIKQSDVEGWEDEDHGSGDGWE